MIEIFTTKGLRHKTLHGFHSVFSYGAVAPPPITSSMFYGETIIYCLEVTVSSKMGWASFSYARNLYEFLKVAITL